MNFSLVSERYAQALFQLALEKGAEEDIYQDSLTISRTCRDSKDLRMLLKSPIINSGKKRSILRQVFGGKIHDITMAYLLIMVRKNRESFIPEIAHYVVELYKTFRNILTVHFSSPVLPDDETRRQVLALMEKYTHATIDLQSETDESLIGGFVLQWKDLQYDASIRRDIENIRNKIAKVNLYKKGF
jgi:F-type H+-transporting ATPase subunit delta